MENLSAKIFSNIANLSLSGVTRLERFVVNKCICSRFIETYVDQLTVIFNVWLSERKSGTLQKGTIPNCFPKKVNMNERKQKHWNEIPKYFYLPVLVSKLILIYNSLNRLSILHIGNNNRNPWVCLQKQDNNLH